MTRATGEQADELLWRSFAYVVGEMDAPEAAGFEALMAESQEAREAVAEAVLIVGATRRAECEARAIPMGGRRRRVWVGVAAALAAACLVVAWLRTGEKEKAAAVPDGAGVALAWTELREPEEAGPTDLAWADEPPAARRGADEEAGPPSWLLLAADSGAEGQGTDDPADGGLLQ